MKLKNLFKKLKPLTNICKVCFCEIDSLHQKWCLCQKCFENLETIYSNFNLCGINCLAIYKYNEQIKSLIYQLKGCGDIELASIFLEYQKHFLRIKYRNYSIVSIPSWIEDDKKRGFNHVEEIFKSLNLKTINCMRKIVPFKQSNLNKEERKKIVDKLEIVNHQQIVGQKILIVDDIYTTGSTIKAAIKLISSCHPRDIKVLVLARNCRKKQD